MQEHGWCEEDNGSTPGERIGIGNDPRCTYVFILFFQMAGNPDQQEDAVDDQYQEEDEVRRVHNTALQHLNK